MNVISFVIQLLIASTESHSVFQKCWSKDEADIGIYQNFSYQLIFVNEDDKVELQCRQWYRNNSSLINTREFNLPFIAPGPMILRMLTYIGRKWM